MIWGTCGITLGLWEAAAFAGRLPTVSVTVCRARRRWPVTVEALVVLWAAGTVRHLLTHRESL